MKKQLVILGIIALLVCVGLSGCTSTNPVDTERNKFIGTWILENAPAPYEMDLFSDGKCSINGVNGTWDIKEEKFVMVMYGVTITASYVFSNNDRTLSLTQNAGEPAEIYTKQ